MGDIFAFVAHLSQGIKDFGMEQLRFGLIVSQIITGSRSIPDF
jgi:hypothetical protein